jgi:hypothetical protein
MSDWLNDLHDKLGRREGSCGCGGYRAKVKAEPQDKWSLPLLGLVVVLTLVLIGAVMHSKGYFDSWTKPNYSQGYSEQKMNPMMYDHLALKVEKRSRWNSEMITLISILNNHNLAVAKYGYPASEYIYINGDWTIDRIPNHVILNEEQKAFLRRYLK